MSVRSQGGGALPKDTNNNAINVASNIVMQDAATIPIVSPFSTSDATTTEIKIPENAVTFIVDVSVGDMRFGDNATLDGTAGNGYSLVGDGKEKAIPCANRNSIFIKRDGATDVTLNFYFEFL